MKKQSETDDEGGYLCVKQQNCINFYIDALDVGEMKKAAARVLTLWLNVVFSS